MQDDDVFDPKRLGAKISERLRTEEPCLVPVADETEDLQRMVQYDLASVVYSRFGENCDPDALRDPEVRDHWLGIALDEGEYFGYYFRFGQRLHWIVQDGERIGTTGYWVRESGLDTTLDLMSVYVRPRYRRQGWASRILQRIKDAAFELGVDRLFLSCQWGNQDALRFYLAQGMWVQNWKDNTRLFIRKRQPALRMVTDGLRTTFLVEDRVVGIADNLGDRLGWKLGEGVEDSPLKWDLEATAALYLALMGWPLIRNDVDWQSHAGMSDCGTFEDLAFRIRSFERHLRKQGWKLPAPNPSFATLPKLTSLERLDNRMEVSFSDGRRYPLPFDVLDPPTRLDAPIFISDDEIRYTARSGEEASENIDHILWLNQSPEHLDQMLVFWRDYRRMRAEGEARRAAEKQAAHVGDND